MKKILNLVKQNFRPIEYLEIVHLIFIETEYTVESRL